MTEMQFEKALFLAMPEAEKSAIEAAIKHNTPLIVCDDETGRTKEISPEKLKKELVN
jgi:hypothetical protein